MTEDRKVKILSALSLTDSQVETDQRQSIIEIETPRGTGAKRRKRVFRWNYGGMLRSC